MPGGGGGRGPELVAVFKPGAEPISYTLGLGAGTGRHDGTIELPVASGKVVIESGDLPPEAGTWTFALHNQGGAGALSGIEVAFE